MKHNLYRHHGLNPAIIILRRGKSESRILFCRETSWVRSLVTGMREKGCWLWGRRGMVLMIISKPTTTRCEWQQIAPVDTLRNIITIHHPRLKRRALTPPLAPSQNNLKCFRVAANGKEEEENHPLSVYDDNAFLSTRGLPTTKAEKKRIAKTRWLCTVGVLCVSTKFRFLITSPPGTCTIRLSLWWSMLYPHPMIRMMMIIIIIWEEKKV